MAKETYGYMTGEKVTFDVEANYGSCNCGWLAKDVYVEVVNENIFKANIEGWAILHLIEAHGGTQGFDRPMYDADTMKDLGI